MGFFLQSLATIMSVVDPIGVAPIFLALTPTMNEQLRARATNIAVGLALLILVIFTIFGRPVLDALGITPAAFSIAGGILMLLIAVDMLFGRISRTRDTPEEEEAALASADISVFTLAIPIHAGPGAITTVILYGSLAGAQPLKIGAVILSVCLALGAAYVSMRVSTVVMRVMGRTGVHVVTRVIGMLLAALAVQLALNGITSFTQGLRH
jgi:multiple antibiotic resistance protein